MNTLEKRGYSFQDEIGKGSFSRVIKATYRDETSRDLSWLACKCVNKKAASSEFLDKFFPRELKMLMELSHPNIIEIHSIFDSSQVMYIFMRWAEKGDLLKYVKTFKFVKEVQAKHWFFQIVSAVKYLHEAGFAHRDLKCENILISKHMNIKITDFGFGRSCVGENNEKILSRTYCGSESYAAPEVIKQILYDPMISDVWSLGVICFVMLCGSTPFNSSNQARLLLDQSGRNYRVPDQIMQKLSPDALQTIHSMLEPVPEARLDINQVYNLKWLNKHRINHN